MRISRRPAVGRHVRFSAEDLDDFVAAGMAQPCAGDRR